MTREWILHLDLDQFIAAVEVLRRPELRGRPVVVGGSGDPTRARQVVATASYEARAFGIRSGMPIRAAAKRCPDAVFLPSDPPTYEAASARVMATVRAFPVVVEVWGWDEAFIGARTDDPERLAEEIRRSVLAETGLSCSIGIGDTRLQAKTATGFAKPAGVARLTGDRWMEVMGPGRSKPSGASGARPRSASPLPASPRSPGSLRPTPPTSRLASARRSARTSGGSGWAATSGRWSTSLGSRARAAGRSRTSRTSPTGRPWTSRSSAWPAS